MRIILLSVVFIGFIALKGQHERGPHNGIVVSAGEYKVEALGCSEYLEVYVYDKYRESMLNYGLKGEVQFVNNDQTSSTSKLVNYANDGFTARFPETTFSYFKVIIEIKGMTYSAKFPNECVVAR